jgi:hypothetical protein
MMNRRITLALIAIGLVALLVSGGPVLAGGGNTGQFTGTRCATFFMWDAELRDIDDFAANPTTVTKRYLSTGQYSEWTVMSENRLVAGLFIDWNTEGNLQVVPTLGPGIYKGQFYLIPEAASGIWEGNSILVFKSDGNKVFTGEGVGRGGELEGLIIRIYFEPEPGGTPRCIDGNSNQFNGEILRSSPSSWR